MIAPPLEASVRVRQFPLVNVALIAACTTAYAIFAVLQALGDDPATAVRIVERYGLIPARVLALISRQEFFSAALYQPFLTSSLVHSGLLHFATNMVLLWALGDSVEERFGHLGYAAFYAAGSTAAALTHVAADPSSVVPTVGASGGIAAVMGAYVTLHPWAWLTFRIPWVSLRAPAWLVLGGWALLQLLAGTSSTGASRGVAWWAHLGGFAFGLAFVLWRGRAPRRAHASR